MMLVLVIPLLMFVVSTVTETVNGFAPPSNYNNNNHNNNKRSPIAAFAADSLHQNQHQLPDMTSFAAGYGTVTAELPSHACIPTEGTSLPLDLTGTYVRVGPAMFSAGSILPPKTSLVQPKQRPTADGAQPDRMVAHPFDADGGILAVTFSRTSTNVDTTTTATTNTAASTTTTTTTTAVSRFRYIRTNAFTRERKAGKRLYTAMDSTRQMQAEAGKRGNDLIVPLFRHHLQPGLNKFRKNTSNTRAIVWAKKLLTLWEGGLPYKLDMLALSTEGRSQLGGVLKEEQSFGAKAVYDPKRERMVFYSNQQDATSSKLTMYEFNAKFKLTNEIATDLAGLALLSDFALTDHYYVLVQPPVAVNAMKYIFNKEPGTVVELQQGPSVRTSLTQPSKTVSSIKNSVILCEYG
jgi:all-trans-8'-apo-beta-carotenal 15,15'-oxygenase